MKHWITPSPTQRSHAKRRAVDAAERGRQGYDTGFMPGSSNQVRHAAADAAGAAARGAQGYDTGFMPGSSKKAGKATAGADEAAERGRQGYDTGFMPGSSNQAAKADADAADAAARGAQGYDTGFMPHSIAPAAAASFVIRALDLFQHSAETQRITLLALSRLVAHTALAAVLSIAGNAGAVRLAVRALRTFPEVNLVISAAFHVLGNLSRMQQFREEALRLRAPVLFVAALHRCANDCNVQGAACFGLARLCVFDDSIAFDALSMGAMELALAALRTHRRQAYTCANASELLNVLSFDEAQAVKAKQLGAPALLQAVLKAHIGDEGVQEEASQALARIQEFVDAASARAEANMAALIAGEEAAKGGKGGASAPKKTGKSKGKSKGCEAAAAPALPPPVAADGEPAPTRAQIKRRKAKAAAAARKAAAAP